MDQKHLGSTWTVSNSLIYSQLPDSTSFRLVRILPAGWDDELQCELEVVAATASREYEALSYVWGDVETRVPIVCNQIATSVTRNLSDALRRLRQQSLARWLWVDALCINQEDLLERSAQVRFMTSIFQGATGVLIWLGEDDKDTVSCLRLLTKAAEQFSQDHATSEYDFETKLPFESEEHLRRGFPPKESPDWAALGRFLARPWFRRIWTVQESAVAVKAVLIIGPHEFPWKTLTTAMDFCNEHNFVRVFIHRDQFLPFVVRSMVDDEPSPLLDLLFLADVASYQATDARDMLFALWGMSIEGMAEINCVLTHPDYEKSLRKVSINLVRHYLECTHSEDGNNLRVLAYIAHTAESIRDENWPSWVFRLGNRVPTYMKYWDNKLTALPLILREPISDEVLVLKGFLYGIATRVEDSMIIASHTSSNWVQVWQAVKRIWMSHTTRIKDNKSELENFQRYFLKTITSSGKLREMTNADFAAYCVHNLHLEITEPEVYGALPEGEDEFIMPNITETDEAIGDRVMLFFLSLRTTTFVITDRGDVGGGCQTMQPGDKICILFGGYVPYVLRPTGNHYRLVGTCEISGNLNGEDFDVMLLCHSERPAHFTEEWFEIR